jgi:hypothetical protein
LVFLIDAKQGARHQDTGKHAIEQSSLKAMLILEKALNIPGWFILPGGAGISAQEAAHAGAKPSAGCGTSKDLMRPWDGRMILAQIGKWWFPFRRLVIRR